jgi:acyl-CoA reductase-like NAD-dependent aldehyde dehydrogenase
LPNGRRAWLAIFVVKTRGHRNDAAVTPLLILVDLQSDYLSARSLDRSAELVVDRAALMLRHCRNLGVRIVHVWTSVSREPDDRMRHWKAMNRWSCELGTPGHQPPVELQPLPTEVVVHKTGFSAFAGGRLAELLQHWGVDTLLVAGVHLHACLRQLIVDAYEAGLEVWVADDATASNDPLHAATTRRYWEDRTVSFAPAEELLRRLASSERHGSSDPDWNAVKSSVERARRAFHVWRRHPQARRAAMIERLAKALTDRAEDLSEAIALEIGKPIHFARVEVRRTVDMLRDVMRHGLHSPDDANAGTSRVRRVPHGVVAVITPWNNPSYIALGKIGPALLWGNAVVWKPALEAGEVSRRLLRMLAEAGCPEGLVALLEGGRRTALALMRHDGVAAVTLTGSSDTGYCAQDACASRRLPLQAELSGNNAAIVWRDADMALAARRVAAGAFEVAGQRCTANRRVILHASCAEPFMDLLQGEAATLIWGDPLKPETRIGPLVNAAHFERVSGSVERAATVCDPPILPLGKKPSSNGKHFYPPTILQCADPTSAIVQEETFGPVLVVQIARDWEHAVDLCNGVRQGLVAAIFTRSEDVADRFLDEAHAGILKVNQSTADAEVGVPFAGLKASGIGPPEHGAFDRDFYTRIQVVYGDWTGVA